MHFAVNEKVTLVCVLLLNCTSLLGGDIIEIQAKRSLINLPLLLCQPLIIKIIISNKDCFLSCSNRYTCLQPFK
jgi:hypothetical protein